MWYCCAAGTHLGKRRHGEPSEDGDLVELDSPRASADSIRHTIHLIRGQHVLLDAELAALYGVETRVLVQAVRRNADRFPSDFMFQLSRDEFAALRSQFVISNGRGGRRYPPYAFTEQGVAMLSSVLDSPRAVQVNIEVMRAFIRLRRLLATDADLARRWTSSNRSTTRSFGWYSTRSVN